MTCHLIIGGGIAGVSAAEQIRKIDPEAEITLLSEEQHPIYSRVLLANYVLDKIPREKLFLKKADWYHAQNIDWIPGVRATKIDHKNRFVETSEGRELPFDKLLLATGGEVNLLPNDRRGVSYLRTLDDADHLRELLAELRLSPESEHHVAVYGGGFISFEYINIFHDLKIPMSVLMRSSGFWPNSLSERSQKILADRAISQGVRLLTREPLPELCGERELIGLRTKGGEEPPARILGVGIGLHTDQSLFQDAGIEVEKGILANQYLETNLEDVYTAGDVAQFYDTFAGCQHVVGNWTNAVMQGRTVAKTMTGERTAFELVSSYATNFLGLEIVAIGDVRRETADDIIELSEKGEAAVEIFSRGGRAVGAVLIGDVAQRTKITQAIKQKTLYVS